LKEAGSQSLQAALEHLGIKLNEDGLSLAKKIKDHYQDLKVIYAGESEKGAHSPLEISL